MIIPKAGSRPALMYYVVSMLKIWGYFLKKSGGYFLKKFGGYFLKKSFFSFLKDFWGLIENFF